MIHKVATQSGTDRTLFDRLSRLAGTALVLLIGWLALSQPAAEIRQAADSCDGYLRGRVFGALDMDLDWAGEKLRCEGMARPDGEGIRLHFAWDQGKDERLILVVGIDGVTSPITGLEKPANVTFIDERSGRFFSSGGAGRCWIDISQLASLPARERSRQLKGTLYCTGALPALNDRSSLTFSDLRFYGRFAFDDD